MELKTIGIDDVMPDPNNPRRESIGRVDVAAEVARMSGLSALPAGSRMRPAVDPLRSKRPDASRRARPTAAQAAAAQLRQSVDIALALAVAAAAIAAAAGALL